MKTRMTRRMMAETRIYELLQQRLGLAPAGA